MILGIIAVIWVVGTILIWPPKFVLPVSNLEIKRMKRLALLWPIYLIGFVIEIIFKKRK